MKAIFVLLTFFTLIGFKTLSQNELVVCDLIETMEHTIIELALENDSIIRLKTRFSSSAIGFIDYRVEGDFAIVLIRLINENYGGYYINAAFRYGEIWVQDYRDRNYAYPNSGLSCTEIIDLQLIDAQTLRIEYQYWSVRNPEGGYVVSNIKLGKYAFYEIEAKSSMSHTKYYNTTEMGRYQRESPRNDYSEQF